MAHDQGPFLAAPGAWRKLSGSRATQGERGIWQRRYWEHAIRDDRDFAAHVDYVHFNPVKHGYVPHPAEWPYSSFLACVAKGLYPPDWIGSDDGGANRGERPTSTHPKPAKL